MWAVRALWAGAAVLTVWLVIVMMLTADHFTTQFVRIR